ncbi:MAG TPA: hypothetical protein DF383_03295 [Deltaproteobacteria bacterium]|nr:hypothetical protein [Deltaproteobacteria bacterium]
MKTSIDISDALFEQIKRLAEKSWTTFRKIVETALRTFFKNKQKPLSRFQLRKHTFKGKGTVDGLSEGDWFRLREHSSKHLH